MIRKANICSAFVLRLKARYDKIIIKLEACYGGMVMVNVDYDNPDLYFYDIESEDEYENKDLRDVWCQCTTCRKVNTIPYNKFITIDEDCLRLKEDLNLNCEGCGKLFINTIVPRRPEGWRESKLWGKDYENLPKCPICSSTKIHKISMTNKAASAIAFGVFAAGHVSKTYKCDICGCKF